MQSQRQNIKHATIQHFREVAEAKGYQCVYGQGKHNRMGVTGDHTDFQFGDLRVETSVLTLVVEVESAGGITNLAKYWYYLSTNVPPKPIILFHIFRQSSLRDYASHLALWDFLAAEMHKSVGQRIQAMRLTYRTLEELEIAVKRFGEFL